MPGPLILAGTGLGMLIAPVINTGTVGVARQDAGVASATVTVGQMPGATGAVIGGVLLRRGPLDQKRTPSPAHGGVTTAQTEVSREQVR